MARAPARIDVLPHAQLCPGGLRFAAPAGQSLVDALLDHGVAIEHACEKVGACSTCHVYVRAGTEALAAPDEEEEDQLDRAWGLEAASRLACRVRLPAGAALTVELPRHTRNHAREG